MEIRATQWMAALVLSAAVHALIVQFMYSPGGTGTTAKGVAVQLGTHAAATEALGAPAETEPTVSEPRPARASSTAPQTVNPLSPRIPESFDVAPQPDVRDAGIEFAAEPAMTSVSAESIEIETATATEPSRAAARTRPETLGPVAANPASEADSLDVATVEGAVAAPAAAAAPDSGAGAAASTAGAPGAAVSSGAGLAQDYYTELALWLGRHKRYPSRARRSGQEGTVEVEFVIDRDGRLLGHRVVSSSGFQLLDEEAYALVQRAAPMPSVPEEMASDTLRITAPISFSLR